MPKFDTTFDPDSYAPVADRIRLFYTRFPAGRIVTELVSRHDGETVFKALVYRDATEQNPASTGWAAEREGDGDINTVACVENTETSAIGRALANLGFTASSRRPSREEMAKAERARARLTLAAGPARTSATRQPHATGATLQPHANAAHDLLELVHVAEARGFSRWRGGVLRSRASSMPPLPHQTVRRIELRMRAWLRRHPM
jgi:hypothetical protein